MDLSREPISPELALVDPVLAAAARAALPEEPWKTFLPAPAPAPAPAPVEVPVAPSAPVAEPPLRWPEELAPEPAAQPHQRSRRLLVTVAFAAAAVAGVVVGGDFIGPRAADRPSFAPESEAADTTVTPRPHVQPPSTVGPPVTTTEATPTTRPLETRPKPETTPKPNPKPKTPARRAKPSKSRAAFVPARTFAWGPVKGATRYRVRFYRGTRLLLQRTTTTARIELPRGFAFPKGSYRWIVEPKIGAKYANAVVDSKFAIP